MYVRYNKIEDKDLDYKVQTNIVPQTKREQGIKDRLPVALGLICGYFLYEYMNAHPEIFREHFGYTMCGFAILLFLNNMFGRKK